MFLKWLKHVEHELKKSMHKKTRINIKKTYVNVMMIY